VLAILSTIIARGSDRTAANVRTVSVDRDYFLAISETDTGPRPTQDWGARQTVYLDQARHKALSQLGRSIYLARGSAVFLGKE
jgi:hypothetical protein